MKYECTAKILLVKYDKIFIKDLDKNLSAFVQAEDYRYDDSMIDMINQLETGMVVDVVLKSQNRLNTVWEFSEINEI